MLGHLLSYLTDLRKKKNGIPTSMAHNYMDVSKNGGAPKWMVKIMENPIKMDDLGVPLFSETSIYPLVVPNIAGWSIPHFQ